MVGFSAFAEGGGFHILLQKPIYIRKSKFSVIYSDQFTICGAAGQQQDQHWRQHEYNNVVGVRLPFFC